VRHCFKRLPNIDEGNAKRTMMALNIQTLGIELRGLCLSVHDRRHSARETV